MKVLLFCALGFFFLACKKDAPVPEKDPIAYYSFNGNAKDQSRFKNHGVIVGAKLTEDHFGTANSAFNFESSYIEVKDQEAFRFVTNNLSITAWIKPFYAGGTYVVQKTAPIIDGQLQGGGGPFSLDIFPGTARAVIYSNDIENPMIVTGTTIIKRNEWQHIAVTWDGKTAKIYYNGQVEATKAFDKTIMVTNGNLYIGTYNWVHPGAAFVGAIDNVRIYNRSISEDEVKELYASYK